MTAVAAVESGPVPKNEGPHRAALRTAKREQRSALACLETRIALADHEHLAATAYDLAVTMPLLRGLEGRKHFHWYASESIGVTENAEL